MVQAREELQQARDQSTELRTQNEAKDAEIATLSQRSAKFIEQLQSRVCASMDRLREAQEREEATDAEIERLRVELAAVMGHPEPIDEGEPPVDSEEEDEEKDEEEAVFDDRLRHLFRSSDSVAESRRNRQMTELRAASGESSSLARR